jgi:hypothetical protein
MNVDSFTYRSFELYTTNMVLPLSHIDDTMESIKSTYGFMVLFLGPGLISMSSHSNKMVNLSCSYRIIKNNGHQLDRHKYITQYTIT